MKMVRKKWNHIMPKYPDKTNFLDFLGIEGYYFGCQKCHVFHESRLLFYEKDGRVLWDCPDCGWVGNDRNASEEREKEAKSLRMKYPPKGGAVYRVISANSPDALEYEMNKYHKLFTVELLNLVITGSDESGYRYHQAVILRGDDHQGI